MITLTNKIFVHTEHKRCTRLKIVIWLCIGFIIISLADGRGIVRSVGPMSMLLLLTSTALSTSQKLGFYREVPCCISADKDELRIENSLVNREDGLGERKEIITMQRYNIKCIEYLSELKALHIMGSGKLETILKTQKRKSKKCKEIYVYPDDEHRDELLDFMKSFYGSAVEEVK